MQTAYTEQVEALEFNQGITQVLEQALHTEAVHLEVQLLKEVAPIEEVLLHQEHLQQEALLIEDRLRAVTLVTKDHQVVLLLVVRQLEALHLEPLHVALVVTEAQVVPLEALHLLDHHLVEEAAEVLVLVVDQEVDEGKPI